MILRSNLVLACVLLGIALGRVVDGKDVKGKVEEVVKVDSWPVDLEPSSQIVFRPLFVYKQKKAAELLRRKAEEEDSSEEEDKDPNRLDSTVQTIEWELRPPSPDLYYAYYDYQTQFRYPPPSNYYYRYPYFPSTTYRRSV